MFKTQETPNARDVFITLCGFSQAEGVMSVSASQGNNAIAEAGNKIRKEQELVSKAFSKLEGMSARTEQFHKFCAEYQTEFSEKAFCDAVENANTDIVKAKQLRKREFELFEFRVPFFAGVVSCVLSTCGLF